MRSSETSGNSDKLPAIGFTISWRVHVVTLPTSSAVLLPHLALVPSISEGDQTGKADCPQWCSSSYVVVMSEDRKLDINVVFKSGQTLYSRVKDTLAIGKSYNVVHCMYIISLAAAARFTLQRPNQDWRPDWGNTRMPAREGWRRSAVVEHV